MSQCAVPGCGQPIPSDLLLCPAHWRRVPVSLKAAVHATWDSRRAALGAPHYPDAVEAHETAKREAVRAVLERTP